MSLRAREDFNSWFADSYADLVATASTLHPDPHDLVHHTYLAVHDAIAGGARIKDHAQYFNSSLWKLSRNVFRKLYARGDAPQKELVSDYDLRDAIRKEEALLLADHLAWFDRTVLSLYLEGWNIAELSRETGINLSTLYESISQSKKKLRHVIRIRTKASR
tara:strand:- start:310 stop:795 length:486 start_codon:yes stop_codon:yes gene_type:complete